MAPNPAFSWDLLKRGPSRPPLSSSLFGSRSSICSLRCRRLGHLHRAHNSSIQLDHVDWSTSTGSQLPEIDTCTYPPCLAASTVELRLGSAPIFRVEINVEESYTGVCSMYGCGYTRMFTRLGSARRSPAVAGSRSLRRSSASTRPCLDDPSSPAGKARLGPGRESDFIYLSVSAEPAQPARFANTTNDRGQTGRNSSVCLPRRELRHRR